MATIQRTTPYPEGLYPEQLPTWLTWAATWAGHTVPDTAKPFRYADLGCGIGLTACWVKRCYPHAEVFGIDADPEHIRASQALADAMSVDVTFLHARFDASLPLPPIDIAVAHGVWSWLDRGARDALVELLRTHLAPGGLAYVDYNALPGRTDWVPLARLVRALVRHGDAPSDVEALTQALEAVEALGDQGFFGPRRELVRSLLSQVKQYPGHHVHEFLSGGWEAHLLADVAHDLAPAGLSYLASTHLYETVEALRTTEEERRRLAPHTDPVMRHTLRDALRNTAFRHDVFGRGARPLPPEQRHEALLARHYALGRELASVRLEGPITPQTMDLLRALDGPPRTGLGLRDTLGWSAPDLVHHLGLVCAAGYVFPSEATLFPGDVDDLMARDVDLLPVLSPSGIELTFTRVDRAIWRALDHDDVAAAALALLQDEGHAAATDRPDAMHAPLEDFRAAIPAMVRAGWTFP